MAGLDFIGIKSALKSIATEKEKLGSSLEELKRKREDAMLLPLPKKDVLEKLNSYVDTVADKYRADAVAAVTLVAGRPMESPDENPGFDRLVRPAGVRDELLPNSTLFALIGATRIKQALADVVNDMEWEQGLPLARRQAEIERLDREIAETEGRLRALINEAERAGVRI